MGNDQRGLGLHFFSIVTLFFVATTRTCFAAQNTSMACFEHERLALLEFKRSVTDVCDMLSSWVGNDCCSWQRVQCDGVTGNVISLHLSRAPLSYPYTDEFTHCLISNELSTSLAELRHLKYLDLSGNDFQESRIPQFLGSFKELIHLNLSAAYFSGIIPNHIGNLSNLNNLDLSYNKYLMVPDMAWISGLLAIELLDLSSVSFSRTKNIGMVFYMVPSLKELRLSNCHLLEDDLGSLRNSSTTTLSSIQHLDLSWNSFSSGRYPSILANMTSLRVLHLSGNHLNSSVPVLPTLLELDLSGNDFKRWEDVEIWRQCQLEQLTVSSNWLRMEWTNSPINISECSHSALEWLDLTSSLKGTIPKSLERMTNLKGLHLSDNELTGSILESLGRLGSLQVFDLSYNMLIGSIPVFLGRLGSLQTVDLSRNELTGPVPDSLVKLESLQVVDLSSNNLIGSIPTFLGKLTKLDLSSNQLNGSIPETLGRLEALTQLILNNNRLTGPISTSLGRLVLLQSLIMSSNFLTGTVPDSIGQLSNLRYLDLSNNSLEGVVSESHFAKLSKLEYLYASDNNNLTFNFSLEYWLPPFQLKQIDLSSCKIVSGFPQLVRNQTNLESLMLVNASISGPLPTWLRENPIIGLMDLSDNNLSGPLTNLPSGERRTRFCSNYYLENNIFNESIPKSLCEIRDLCLVNFSKNKLTGEIPECLVNMKNLLHLGLSSNRLSGVIPSYTGNAATSLSILALDGNNLSGELSQDFWNLKSLTVLNLGNNALCGKIPEWAGEEVKDLIIFRLHKNNFTGEIPRSLCKASQLHILDFAHNNLTGIIPHCLGKLSAMANKSYDSYDPFYFRTPMNAVTQVINGVARDYTRTLEYVINMDLSSNQLVGKIPLELTALHELVGLNLSNNHLTGGIPWSIGNMRKLISLDFSGNDLSGLIPPSLGNLNFLSHLNFSHNKLTGRIPTGRQLQTLNDPSVYAGNEYLCGDPLPKNCSNHEDPTTTITNNHDESNKVWYYLDITCGFATGFWGFIMVLVFKKAWRHKLFMFSEDTMDKIYVTAMIRVNKMKRGREAT